MQEKTANRKEYLISLYRTRSILALIAGIGVFCVTFAAVAWGLQEFGDEEGSLFQYFTVLSNLLAAVGAAFMIPFAVEGIRKKRFLLPKWVVLLQYSGAVCVAITMISTLLIIIPTQGVEEGLTGMNFWLHLISPLLTVILFQMAETGVSITRREMFLALVPYWIYMALYFVMVYLVDSQQGGWADIYNTKGILPPWAVALMMFVLGLVTAIVLRWIQNRRARSSRERIVRLWDKKMDSTELKIEAFGLGRYMGLHGSGGELSVPLDIFEMMAERYDVTLPELIRAFTRGALDGREEKTDK